MFNSQRDFEKLYSQYSGMVRAVLYNMVGGSALDDLTQEVFLKIWQGESLFSSKSSKKTWVYRITVNTAIDYLRKRQTQPQGSEEGLAEVLASGTHPVEVMALQRALLELSEELRVVVILVYFEDLLISEVAKILDIPEGTVKSRLSTARARLQSQLEEVG